MAGLEDLAKGLERFRRTPERTHDAYLEPMRQSLLALSRAKREAEEAAGKPEHYFQRTQQQFNFQRDQQRYNFWHQIFSTSWIDAESLKRWLAEFRGHELSPIDAATASQLRQLDANLLLHFYKLPLCEYIKQAYPELALKAEEEANAVAATVKDFEIRRIAPFLLFLAQCNLPSLDRVDTGTLAQYGVPLSAIGPEQLEGLVSKFVTEEVGGKYYARTAHTADDVTVHHSDIIARLGVKKEGISPANTFLISSQGAPQGFLMLYNERGAHSPLYAIAHLKDKPAAAIMVAERFAAHLGYSAVKLHMLLDEGTTEAASDAGLSLLWQQGFSKETHTGVFVDVTGSDEAHKKIYGAFSKAHLGFWAANVQESSGKESVIKAATLTNLAPAEFFNRERRGRRLPDKKIQSLVLRTSGQGRTANYVFSFDNTFTDKRIYVIRGNENGSNGSLEEMVAKAANEVAQFFNGSAKRIGPEEMYGGEPDEEVPSKKARNLGVFYCAHSEGLPNAAVRVRANFSIGEVLRFVESIAKAAGYGQARIDVCYGNLSPEELAAITNALPISKMSAVREVTLRNLKAEDIESETFPPYIDRAVIEALSINTKPSISAESWLLDYDSSSGMPRVTVKPVSPVLPTDETGLAGLRRELSRVVHAVFEDHCARGLTPGIGGRFGFPEISDGSALIRLALLPSPSVLKVAFDALFPGIYFVKELRYRSRVEGHDFVKRLYGI